MKRAITNGWLMVMGVVALLAVAVPADADAGRAAVISCKGRNRCVQSGKLHGAIQLQWPDGAIRAKGEMKLGKRHGRWTLYWPNGKRLAELYYSDGKLSGPATVWHVNGRKRASGAFVNGARGGAWQAWNDKGVAIAQPRGKQLPTKLAGAQRSQLRARAQRYLAAANTLQGLAAKPAPASLTRKERTKYAEQSKWFSDVAARFQSLAAVGLSVAGTAIPGGNALDSALAAGFGGNGGAALQGLGADGSAMLSEMAAMNMQFLALQQAIQSESRTFQTLSNASKARHDIAMASIKNTRA
jgi:hypothetical protein